jgi:hypothetical protein
MNRRTFNKLAGFAALAALAEIEIDAEQAAVATGEIVLQDDMLLVAFDPVSGALTRMEYKLAKWTVERRPALGASFRMLVPIPNRRRQLRARAKSESSQRGKNLREPGSIGVEEPCERARRRAAHHF